MRAAGPCRRSSEVLAISAIRRFRQPSWVEWGSIAKDFLEPPD